MKKFLLIALALILVVGLSACGGGGGGGSQDQEPGDEPEQSLIGICVPGADHGWVAAVAYFAEKQAKELGIDYKLVASANTNEQANQIDDLINLGCDTIVLFPHNNELDVAAQKILDAGIKLVNFDRKVDVDATCYLAGDNPGIGVNGAKYIGDKLGGEGKVVIMHVPAYGSIDVERVDAFKETVAAEYPGIEIIGDYGAPSSSKEDGLKTMIDVLTANSQIDGIYSMDDELSLGILQAIKDAGRTDVKVITGGGGAQEYFNVMKDSDINIASALYSPSMIMQCVIIADNITNKGGSVEKEIILPATIVDKTNVDEFLDAGSPY